MIQKKICLLGASSVGKTSLVKQFVEGIFSEKYLTTIGVKIDKKVITIENEEIQLMLWDIEGTDRYNVFQERYLRGAAGYIIVVDQTRATSLSEGVDIHTLARQITNCPAILAVNKNDLAPTWHLDDSENKSYQVATHSIAIARSGQLVYERYAPEITPDTPLYGFSLGKTLAVLLAGKLSAQGQFDIHQALSYNAWQDGRSNISSHHLMTMTSGLQFDESYVEATSDANMLFVADDMADLAINKMLVMPAGQEFKYSTANSFILADQFNQQLGGLENTYREFQSLMREISVNSVIVQADGHGTMTFGMQDLISTRDLLRIGQFMLQKGRWNGEKIIPTSWFDYMQTPILAEMGLLIIS